MITTSLELSKRLKEAGWNEPTYFMWFNMRGDEWELHRYRNNGLQGDCFAPTAEEIIEKLPKRLESSGDYFFLNCHRDGQWLVSYYSMLQDYTCYINDERIAVYGESLADACALMCIHLKEHNLLPLA